MIRVWFNGPTVCTDEHGTRTEGTYADLPGDTRTRTSFHPTREAPDWQHSTIAKEQAHDRMVPAWVRHDDTWKEGRVEASVDTAIRAAVLAEREACAEAVRGLRNAEPAGSPRRDAMAEAVLVINARGMR